MGLACGKPFDPADNFKITYYAPQPRAVVEVVNFDNYDELVDYDETGRVKLYTLTHELFIPASWNVMKENANVHTKISMGRRLGNSTVS
jgi:hypothetical protein